MSANIYRGGIIGAEPAETSYPYKSGVWGIGESGVTYDDWLQPPPDILDSAKVWLDASDLSTITEASGSVSQWDNKGTLGNFSQSTAALQPTTGVTTLNGLNVIDFNYDNLNASTAADWRFMNDGTKWLFLVVAKTTSDGNMGAAGTHNGDWFYTGGSIGFSSGANPGVVGSVLRGVGSTVVVSASSGTGSLNSGTWYVGQGLMDPTNATASLRGTIYVDDGSAVNNNTYSAAVDTGNPDFPLQIGALGNGLYDLLGSIAELIIFDGTLANDTNRQIVRNYLNAKWQVY